jgi:hypothetical protein
MRARICSAAAHLAGVGEEDHRVDDAVAERLPASGSARHEGWPVRA